jgi:hypothetical protein
VSTISYISHPLKEKSLKYLSIYIRFVILLKNYKKGF